jgi:hypothetical protein
MVDPEDTLDAIDSALLGSIRDNQRKLDEYNANRLIAEAAALGVTLERLPWEEYPDMTFRYRPACELWPELHLRKFPRDWRISVVGLPGATYDRSWRWHIMDRPGSFGLAVRELASWGGDPDREPAGWTQRDD